MSSFIVEGGHRLSGTIRPQGAKNEALQIISAVLMTKEEVRISTIQEILDIRNLILLLASMGVKVTRHEKGVYTFKADEIDAEYVMSSDFVDKCAKLRGSVMVVGPLLARFGRAYFPKPGGDQIGRRRVDTHILGFMHLGAEQEYDHDKKAFYLHVPQGHSLEGKYMLLDEASVTGTANILMAAVLAKGVTTIYNAACEPYLQQLCKMLVSMGAKIEGIGSNLLTVTGVESLGGTEHRILPDMIEIGSFIALAAMNRSSITIKDVAYDQLGMIPGVFRKLGVNLERRGDDIYVPEQESYVIDSFLDGSVLIHQKMFESRLFFVDKLIDMGAQIILCDPHRAVVVGHDHKYQLRAGKMASPDIRAGIALLIAAMSAKGTSVISNIDQIDRGYEDIDVRLNALGARITRQ